MAGKKAKPKKNPKKPNLNKLQATDVVCPVCRTIFIEPVSLPCYHAFCKECFEKTMEKNNLVCPLCRMRVGSWYRTANKDNKIVDTDFWNAIQTQFLNELVNKRKGIDNEIEKEQSIRIVSEPGEIRKEYEKQREKDIEEQNRLKAEQERASVALIKKINEQEELKKQIEKEKLQLDEIVAKQLEKDMQTPSCSYNRNSRKSGPLDRFVVRNAEINGTCSRKNSLGMTKTPEVKSFTKNSSGKEYTCHVLPVENNHKPNHVKNVFSDLDSSLREIFASQNKSQQQRQEERRKTLSQQQRQEERRRTLSSYKSSCSSDVIDQECKYYFKPVSVQKRTHIVGKNPVKLKFILGVNDGNVNIEAPSGILPAIGSPHSAFARYPSLFSPAKISPILSATPKSAKRKVQNSHSEPTKKRRLFDKELSSDEKCEFFVNNSPFYGFDTLLVQKAERDKEIVQNLVFTAPVNTVNRFNIGRVKKQSDTEKLLSLTVNNESKRVNNKLSHKKRSTINNVSNRSAKIVSTALQKPEPKRPKRIINRNISPIFEKMQRINMTPVNGQKSPKKQTPKSSARKKKLSVVLMRATRQNTKIEELDSPSTSKCDLNKKLQEEKDLEYARKLQAQFDLIQVTSTTRRGTKRQVKLDEMFAK